MQDTNWYRARNKTGASGLIPVNYVREKGAVKLHAMPYVTALSLLCVA